MPRPRNSYNQADLKGSLQQNRGRYADRVNMPATKGDIGDPPKYFKAALKTIWFEIVRFLPHGVAGEADRIAIEMASRLLFSFRTDPDMQASKVSILMNLLSRLGMDPQARTKLQVAEPAPKKPVSTIERFMQKAKPDGDTYLIQ